MSECIICMDIKNFVSLGDCNHSRTCLECTYKNRVIAKNKRCAFCNKDLPIVVVCQNDTTIPNFEDCESIGEYKAGIHYLYEQDKIECLKLENKVCPIKSCQKVFISIDQLTNHLDSAHRRYFCDLCIKNRTLLLNEQQLYQYNELNEHQKIGDFDSEGNLIFCHPLCVFCKQYQFNDDFLLEHLRKEHFNCGLCDAKSTRYMYYDNFHKLSQHYESSHFMCTYSECQKARAFKEEFELNKHIMNEHKGSSKVPILASSSGTKKPDFTMGFDFSDSVI